MVGLDEKKDFVNFIVKNYFAENENVCNFFNKLLSHLELLQCIDFYITKPIIKYKYKMSINLRHDVFIFEKDGRKNSDSNILNFIEELLSDLKDLRPHILSIHIMDKQNMIKTKLKLVCETSSMIENLIDDAFIDFMIKDEKKKLVMQQIDLAILNGNKEEFNKLSLICKEFLK